MLQVVVYGLHCFGLVDAERCIVWNPGLQQKEIIPWSKVSHIFYTPEVVHSHTLNDLDVIHLTHSGYKDAICTIYADVEGVWVLQYCDVSLVLVQNPENAFVALQRLSSPCTILYDLSKGSTTGRCEQLASYNVRYVLPIAVLDPQSAIDFCRDIMLYTKAVPKYLKTSQYLVLDVH